MKKIEIHLENDAVLIAFFYYYSATPQTATDAGENAKIDIVQRYVQFSEDFGLMEFSDLGSMPDVKQYIFEHPEEWEQASDLWQAIIKA